MSEGEWAWFRTGSGGAWLRLHLLSFRPPPPGWRHLACLHQWREGAEFLLGAGLPALAAIAFSRGLRLAVSLCGGGGTSGGRGQALKAELHSGLAECQLRLRLPWAALANGGKALELSPAHLEARLKRARAAAAMLDLEMAEEEVRRVLRAEPDHAPARLLLLQVRALLRQRDRRLARRLGRLFA
ncbi:FKBPL protein, partial [Turnix velox]|nr:FKBPL protein [Turnix velox]